MLRDLGIDALSFDLFNTLIDERIDRLPMIEWGGRRIPSTAGRLHEHLARGSEIALERFLAVLAEADRDLRKPYYGQGRELPTVVRFAEVVTRLGSELGANVDPDRLAEELCELHMAAIRDLSELPSHHVETLARLRRRRPIALCSNFSHTPTAERILEDFGLRVHLDLVVVSEAVGIRKPRREIFDAVVEGLGVAPERILHIGDNLKADVGGAAALGMRTVWITRRVPDPEAALAAYEGPPPDLVVGDLAELEDALAG